MAKKTGNIFTPGICKLKPIERQVLMYEMFSRCQIVDNMVINQYFPYCKEKSRNPQLPEAFKATLKRDLRILKMAGLIKYTYNQAEYCYETEWGYDEINLPDDISESEAEHVKKLNRICRFYDEVYGMDEDLNVEREIEEMEDEEFANNLLNYFWEYSHLDVDISSLTDYELFKYTDPYVRTYIRMTGCSDLKQIKEDFEVLAHTGHLGYDVPERRFCLLSFNYGQIRQNFGIVIGDDGKLYIGAYDPDEDYI